MIKRIRVQNFLSLKDVDLDLRDRNVFVGANMSGKSNLIECLKFLQEALTRSNTNTSSLQQAFANRGGFDEVPWQGEAENPIRIEIVVDLPSVSKRASSFNYSVSLRRGEYGYLEVVSEVLTSGRKGENETLLDNGPEGVRIATAEDAPRNGPRNIHGLALEAFPLPMAQIFIDFVRRWRFYNLVPALMRSSNVPAWEKHLSEHGENLSAWLLTLQNYPREFEILRKVVRDALPGVTGILFQPVEPPNQPLSTGQQVALTIEPAKISIGASETSHRKPISIARMSDGELAFLGLLSLILAPEELLPFADMHRGTGKLPSPATARDFSRGASQPKRY